MNAEHCERDYQACVREVRQRVETLKSQLRQEYEELYNKKYEVKRGDTLFRIALEKLRLPNSLIYYSKIIKTNFPDGEIVYEQTMPDFKEIEVGDKIYMEDGVIMIERSPIKKYKYVIKENNEDIYNITNDELNLGFPVNRYVLAERIFFKEEKINGVLNRQLSDSYPLEKGDILTVKCVNGVWQYLMERPLKTIKTDDIAIPILSDQKKTKPQKFQKSQEQEKPFKKIEKKKPLEVTKYYAKRLSEGLPESKQTEFLTELTRRLNEFNQSEEFKTLNLDKLDAKYTEIRIEWGRKFFSKLSGSDFEIFYKNKGLGPKAFGTLMGNILGKELSVVTPDIKDIKGKYANDREIRRFIDGKYESLIKKHTSNDTLFKAIIKRETKGDSYAVSKTGAMGVMQLMPILFLSSDEFPTPINPFNKIAAIRRGIIAYQHMEQRNRQVISKVSKSLYAKIDPLFLGLHSYNGGEGYVRRLILGNKNKKSYGVNYASKLRKETRNYAILIQNYMKAWESPNLVAQK